MAIKTVFISLGSNVFPQKNIPACLLLLKKNFCVRKISAIYETDPIGPSGNQKFWNAAVEMETDLNIAALEKRLREIENALGRKRNPSDKYAPRTIDLDIISTVDGNTDAFIVIPLADIAPDRMDSKSGKTVGQLAQGLISEKKSFRKIRHPEERKRRRI